MALPDALFYHNYRRISISGLNRPRKINFYTKRTAVQNSAQQSFFAFIGLFADGKGAESSLFKVAAVQLLHQFDEREGVLCAGGLVAGVHRQLG